MKKPFILFILLSLLSSIWAADNKKGVYVARFYVDYKNIDNYLANVGNISINNYLSLENNKNKDITFHIHHSGFKQNSSNTREIQVEESVYNLNFYTDFSSTVHSVRIDESIYSYNLKNINIKPYKDNLGKGDFKIYIKNTFTGNTTSKTFTIDYNLEIRPKEIKCDSIEKTDNENLLLYEKPICIQATKGFPKEVYKWRYSYKNANGVTIEGNFTPFKTEDNGATIYVKGSDFLSESQFNELVESQNGITIIPDGANGYNKPLSVDGVNLTAKPTCPFIIKPIEVLQPKCNGYNAERVKIKLNRGLLKGEVVKFLLSHENGVPQIADNLSLTGEDEIIFDYNDRIIIGIWDVQISGTYLDKHNQPSSSYSETNNHQGEFTITAPDPVTINIISQTTTSCIGRADGTISCEVNGGTGKKTCSLYSSDKKFISNGTFMDGKFLFTGLSKGSYYIEATDKNGCISERSNSIEILEPEPLKIEVSDITDLRCYGDSVGVVYCSFSGGTGRKTIILEDEAHKFLKDYKQSANMEDDTICIFNDLSAGTYYLSATDEKGCVTNNDTEFEISEPDSLWLKLTTTDATIFGNCNGTLSASFGGGTDSYTIKYLENENTYSWPQENIELSEYLCVGESEVTLIDGNNCTTTKKYIINQPDPLAAKVIQIDSIKCFGESTASLKVDSITGGMGGYTIQWVGSGDFKSQDTLISNLSAGYYWITLGDSVGAEIEYEILIDQPKKIELFSTDIKPVFCSGDSTGSISLIAEGGTLPYKFFLEDTLSTSGEYASLPAGTYTARVEDKNNCITEGLFTIETLSTLTAKISAESPKCDYLNDGFIDLSVEDGLEPYKITWYAEDRVLMEDIFKMSELSAGEYSVIVQDAAGCIEKVDTTLYKPEEFNIELPEKLYLCIDQYYPITLENSRIDSVTWYLENQKFAKSTTEHLSKEGEYSLDIIYDKLTISH